MSAPLQTLTLRQGWIGYEMEHHAAREPQSHQQTEPHSDPAMEQGEPP